MKFLFNVLIMFFLSSCASSGSLRNIDAKPAGRAVLVGEYEFDLGDSADFIRKKLGSPDLVTTTMDSKLIFRYDDLNIDFYFDLGKRLVDWKKRVYLP